MSRRLEGRNGEIYRGYVLGATQDLLADKYGLSQERVGQIIRAVMAGIPEEDLAERRKKVLDNLDVLSQVAAEVMEQGVSQAYSNGRPMFDENGQPIMDYGTRLAALDRVIKIGERQAKLLGLDATVKVDVTVSEQAKQAAAQAAADAMAFLTEDGEATEG